MVGTSNLGCDQSIERNANLEVAHQKGTTWNPRDDLSQVSSMDMHL